MTPTEFIKNYERALGTQDWKQVAPLVHERATVIFSSGAINAGKANVQQAFERNFSIIKNEHYSIENIRWLLVTDSVAMYLFDYYWKGYINEQLHQGGGQGTSVLVYENDQWWLLSEHLGAKQKED